MFRRKQRCPVCNQPMKWYENPGRWKCVNIKVHDRAVARLIKGATFKGNPSGGNRKKPR